MMGQMKSFPAMAGRTPPRPLQKQGSLRANARQQMIAMQAPEEKEIDRSCFDLVLRGGREGEERKREKRTMQGEWDK
jgi:hypothetical protein